MLQLIVDWLIYSLFRFPPGDPLSGAVNFFVYDSLKIIALLFTMISVIGFLRTFLPQQQMKGWLLARGSLAYFYAALFGAVTPFCSCSSIPIFLSFLTLGVPLGVTLTFLVASPLINEYLVVLMFGFFGWRITVLYILSGMVMGIMVGIFLGKMKLERFLEQDLFLSRVADEGEMISDARSRIRFGLSEGCEIVRKIWFWVVAGVAVGAVIHNYIPDTVIQTVIGRAGIFSVPLATLLGVPLYGNCAAILPVAVVLFHKGVPLGTALAFMMAVSALSFPEAVILRRSMKLPLIALYFGITSVGIMITGYLFNYLQNVFVP